MQRLNRRKTDVGPITEEEREHRRWRGKEPSHHHRRRSAWRQSAARIRDGGIPYRSPDPSTRSLRCHPERSEKSVSGDGLRNRKQPSRCILQRGGLFFELPIPRGAITIKPRACPNCQTQIAIVNGYTFDDDLTMRCATCGKPVFPLARRPEREHLPYSPMGNFLQGAFDNRMPWNPDSY